MEPDKNLPRKKLPLVPLAVALLGVAVLAYFLFRGVNYRALEDRVLGTVRGLGPWAFFSAMAILPALSVPLSLFTLTAGELFAPLMTLPGVIVAAFVAIGINMVLTYWLAALRPALRPLLSELIARYGYTIPQDHEGQRPLGDPVPLRLTPGPPLFPAVVHPRRGRESRSRCLHHHVPPLQARSLGASASSSSASGRASNGNFRMVMYGIGVLVVAGVVVNWIRRNNASRAA